MSQSPLSSLQAATMHGQAELWLDPMGNEVATSDCTITVSDDGFQYTWSYEGKPHAGKLQLTETGAEWRDSWHQKKPMLLKAVAPSWALVDVTGTYSAGEGPEWGWRISLSRRPTGELVLQMTNVTPWGEHGRAVRMVATP